MSFPVGDQLVGLVVLADDDHPWFPDGCFLGLEVDEGEDDQEVAHAALVRGRSVQGDLPGSLWRGDAVGLEPFPVGDVSDENLLVMQESGLLHEGAVDGKAARIIGGYSRNGRPVKLGFQ